MGPQPSYRIEARIYGRYILKNLPNAKIAVLYQNDDFGKDYLVGLRQALGDKADKMIVATKTYETTDPTVESQIVALQASGADFGRPRRSPNSPPKRSAKSTTSAGSRRIPDQRSISVGFKNEARRILEGRRHHHRRLSERPERSAVAEYQGIQGLGGPVHEEILLELVALPT